MLEFLSDSSRRFSRSVSESNLVHDEWEIEGCLPSRLQIDRLHQLGNSTTESKITFRSTTEEMRNPNPSNASSS